MAKIYKPYKHYGMMTAPLENEVGFGSKKGEPRCHAEVYCGTYRRFSQCQSSASVIEENGNQWCGNHSPAAEKRRADKRQAATDARNAKWSRYEIQNQTSIRVIAALREIEAGHNDPRALAREVLEAYDAARKGDTPT